MRHIYSVIRFVPDPIRGEFINIGAIVGSEQTSEWKLRLAENTKRARALDEYGVLAGALGYADELARHLDAFEQALESSSDTPDDVGESWLTRLWQESRNILQLSRPMPIVAADADAALDIVFEEFIRESPETTAPARRKYQALAAVRNAYAHQGLLKGMHLAEQKIVNGPEHDVKFDFTVANGRVVQLTQTFSLVRADTTALLDDIKAWAWGARHIREFGGTIDGMREDALVVPPQVDIEVVYIAPEVVTPQNRAYREALTTFREVGAEAVPVERANVVGERAAKLLVSAGAMLDLSIRRNS